MQKKRFIGLMERYGQQHIINHLKTLTPEEEKDFLNNATELNFELVFRLYEKISSQKEETVGYKKIEPHGVIENNNTSKEQKDEILHLGEKAIINGETAVLIVAGGQGTRLGYPHPKGMYPISPIKGKSLFQINSEKVLALSQRYNIRIPLLIMTNLENRKEIEEFFKENRFFGLKKENLFFFTQEMLPSITPDRKLVLKNRTSLLSNPDGHGGSLKAIWRSGLIKKLEGLGITKIFYCHIDNPLIKVDDPFFLGWHIREKSDFSLKVVRKKYPGEKVGNFVMAGGKPRMIEYIEMPEKLRDMKDSKGNPVFWAGSIGIHFINTDFIKKINRNGFALPYHRQVKKASGGRYMESEQVWKFETFVFDALPLTKKVCCLETIREEEFAPLKNSEGENSPEKVKNAMLRYYKKQLTDKGIKVSAGVKIEISPLVNLDKIEIPSPITKDTYIN
jgi:UDP-N-acetylglucosamine/UDP-N-acetylgalactosamine diphosphorylase